MSSTLVKFYAYAHAVDPFGVSNYLSRPTLLFHRLGPPREPLGGPTSTTCGSCTLCGLESWSPSRRTLFRQVLPRGWALFACAIVGVSHLSS